MVSEDFQREFEVAVHVTVTQRDMERVHDLSNNHLKPPNLCQ
jgi:hypothetical protein